MLSVLVVLGAIGLAAYMLVTAGDDGSEQTDAPAPVTQPTPTPTDTASSEPTKDSGDKNDGTKNDNGDKNNKNDGTKNDNGDKNNKNDGTKNDNGDKNNKNDGDKNDGDAKPVPQIPVYVFNQTTITGLAAETAASLESAGWNVVGADNWIGHVPSDTVYFYPGDRAAADRLSKDFPDIGRVWPASAPMPAGALTVILADTARK